VHPEAARATLSRPARRFNAGASERSSALAGHECGTDRFGWEARAGDEEGSDWSVAAVAAVRTPANKRCCTLILPRI
jgi:hypothetical protein